MRSVLVIYEDEYQSQLHALLRKVRSDLGLAPICLHTTSARGTGGFAATIRAMVNLPRSCGAPPHRAPDLVLCVADSDKPAGLVPGFKRCPAIGDEGVEQWVRGLEGEWHTRLTSEASLEPQEAARVRVCCLRWCKESLLIASIDTVRQTLSMSDEGAIDELMASCEPNPATFEGVAPTFTDVFRQPQRCIKQVVERGRGPDRPYKKGRDDEDVLEALANNVDARQTVRERCPDLDHIARAME